MRKMAVRKNQAALSAPEKQKFVQAVLALKAEKRGNTNTYDRYVWEHRDTAPTDPATGEPSPDYAHAGPAFFPWHREYLLRFEADLQRISGDPNLGLPYWDWSVDQAPPSWPFTADFLGGNGRDSDGKVLDGEFAFDARKDGDPKKWVLNVRIEAEEPTNYLRRQFGKDRDVTSLPTPEDVRAALRATPYDVDPWNSSSQSGFRNIAEGFFGGPPPQQPQMHNRVHVWVGGSMGPMTSPNDPVFFLHHCFVDKLWADWQVLQPQLGGVRDCSLYLPPHGARQGHNLNDSMRIWPDQNVIVQPAHLLVHHHQLGYRYDTDADMQFMETLSPGERLWSWNKQYYLTYQSDGDLVFYSNTTNWPIWTSETKGQPVGFCTIDEYDLLVIYGPNGRPIRTFGGDLGDGVINDHNGRLVVQDDGKIVLYRSDGRAFWTKP
jgi:tyrosinase